MSKRDDTVILYRRVFGTSHGNEVLADILDELGFFSTTDEGNPGDVALLNFARRLLIKCGLGFDTAAERVTVTESLLGIEPVMDEPPKKKEG